MRSRIAQVSIASLGLVLCLATGCKEDSRDDASDTAGAGGAGISGAGGASGSSGVGGAGSGGAAGSTPTAGAGAGTGGAPSNDPPCPGFSDDPAALAAIGVTVLLPGDIFGVQVAGVADGHVYYFMNDDLLQRVPVAGGATEEVGTIAGSTRPLVLSDLLVWGETDETAMTSRLVSAPLSDPATTTVLVESTPNVEYLLADDEHIYWASRQPANIYRIPRAGGEAETFIPDGAPLGSVLSDGYYYWQDFQTSFLERIPVAGGTREPLVELHFGGPMAADADGIYWGDTSLKTIEKWTPAGGREQLAGADPNDVAVHGGVIYWSNGFITSSIRSIRTDGTEPRGVLCAVTDATTLFVEGDALIVGSDDGILRIDL